ncbi:Hydrogen peroxide-inducible genes activator [Pseudomonas fluorescens]|uniref:Hydrogen peroxide-inducible genes activator n=1 Tax=Pseudomonas fluorescens TaxID=294 RepID=A0A5E7SJI0_PSEFL|nr:LysR family transcriptional regulator [Pseudomonas fluorescens]VVP85787.1 Hydrogen peroxide-inducible genes activator [Pseudomonas fluorescens]
MNLKQLQSVLLMDELGSISRTAVALGTAQSLVSRQLAQLEAEWGDQIFERTGRGLVVSDFGRLVLPEIRLLLAQAERLETLVRESSGVPAGTVHIGILPSMSRRLLPMLFTKLQTHAPGVRLHVVEGFSGDLDEQLAGGALDLIVVNRYGISNARDEETLGVVDTYLVGKAATLGGLGQSIEFAALPDYPLILPSRPNGLRTTLDQLARKQQLSLNVAIEVDTLNAMKDVAAAGGAFTILPFLAVQDDVERGLLDAVRIDKPQIKRTIALAFTHQHPLSRAARIVGGYVRELSKVLLE